MGGVLKPSIGVFESLFRSWKCRDPLGMLGSRFGDEKRVFCCQRPKLRRNFEVATQFLVRGKVATKVATQFSDLRPNLVTAIIFKP